MPKKEAARASTAREVETARSEMMAAKKDATIQVALWELAEQTLQGLRNSVLAIADTVDDADLADKLRKAVEAATYDDHDVTGGEVKLWDDEYNERKAREAKK